MSILLSVLLLLMGSINAFAAGGAVSIGDDNSETLFTGSASSHYLVLSSNGVVSAWGENTYGQCGAEPCDEITEINYIDFENKIVKIAAGNGFSIALDENNTAWGWGNNIKFQLGISRPTGPGTPTQFSSPTKIADNIVDIAAGEDFSVLLNEDGEVLFSGMGNANTLRVFNFPEIDGLIPKINFITANYNNIVAIGENNLVFHWKSEMKSAEVIELTDVDEVQSAVVGEEHIIIRCLNGENIDFYAYGDNSKNQLGIPDLLSVTEPVLVLSIPYDENQIINEFAGEYCTVVNVWDTLSAGNLMTEYCWGTDYCLFENEPTINRTVITEPESFMVDYQIIALGEQNHLAFNFITNDIVLFGLDNEPEIFPLIEADEEINTMYEYQYQDVEYHTYNLNFIELKEEMFSDENTEYDESTETYSDKYSYWEFVNEHQFRVKVKDFINGLGNSRFNPAISTIILSKEVTGENRNIGTYGPSIWNFNIQDEIFKTEVMEINHGDEDGTEIVVSAYILKNRAEAPLSIPSDVKVFYENPGTITEDTKLGLYLYGLPEGTTGIITDISDNTFKITLSGNSTEDMDYDSVIRLCYIRTEENQDEGELVGDYNLNEVSVLAGEGKLSGFSIKASENTPEKLIVSGSLTKGKENGKIINASISGGNFAKTLSLESWDILGVDGVSISSIERTDDNNVRITLSGNSTDKYTDAELKIRCDASQYSDSRVYDEDTGMYMESELLSENHIAVVRQSKDSGNSVSSTIAKPTSSIESGEVVKGTMVELLSTVNNSKIYYTTDGTQPTTQSALYQTPIEITGDVTIKFISVLGSRKSSVQTVTYTVKSADINLKENAEEIQYIEVTDNRFNPDEAMSRYEILSALNNLFDIENLNVKSEFTDVDNKYLPLVDLFVGAGIIEGYPNDSFRGDSGITRAEFVKVLSIMLNAEVSDETVFDDISGHWCEKYINGFVTLGWLRGYPDGSFRPDNMITKAEVITVLNRIANKNTEDADPIVFDDVLDNHWAYGDICAAIKVMY